MGRKKKLHVALNYAIGNKVLFLLRILGRFAGKFLSAQFRHSFLQYLLVGFIAEVGDKSALLRSKKIAGASDVKVLHGNMDSAAEIAETFYCLQASACCRRQRYVGWDKKVAECLSAASADTSSQLVQLA